jgi:hypothetical protein
VCFVIVFTDYYMYQFICLLHPPLLHCVLYTVLAAANIVENQKRACQLIRAAKKMAPEGGSVSSLGTGSFRGSEVEGVGSGVGIGVGSGVGIVGAVSGGAAEVGSGIVGVGPVVLVAGVGSSVVGAMHVGPV